MDIIEVSLLKPPLWAPQPLVDLSWKELSRRYVLTASSPGPVRIDLSQIPEEFLTQLKLALKKGKITTNVEESKILMYNFSKEKKEKEAVADFSKSYFTDEEVEEANKILDKSIKKVEKNINTLLEENKVSTLRLLRKLESEGKGRSTLLGKIDKALKDIISLIDGGEGGMMIMHTVDTVEED